MTPLRQRAEAVVAALTIEPNKGSFEADAHEWSVKCKTTEELIALIHAALEQVVEDCAVIAEEKFNHRKPEQYDAYRRGDFTLDHEAAGDTIATAIRQQGAR